jgi:alpha-galactosidase
VTENVLSLQTLANELRRCHTLRNEMNHFVTNLQVRGWTPLPSGAGISMFSYCTFLTKSHVKLESCTHGISRAKRDSQN